MNWFHVAQKNSIAKQAANILSKHQKRLGHSLSKFNPVYQFAIDGESHVFSSVRGHLFEYDLPQECQSWATFDNRKILTSEISIIRKCDDQMKPVVANIQNQAKKAQKLILWLDCDRQGEAIAFQVAEIALQVKPNLIIKRARFSALTTTDIRSAYNNLVLPNKKESEAVIYRIEIDFRLGCAFTRFQSVIFGKYYRLKEHTVISYGPCQMPTLGFVVMRYLQIKYFNPKQYWVIKCKGIINEKEAIDFKWVKKCTYNQTQAHAIFISLFQGSTDYSLKLKIIAKQKKLRKKYRPYPLTTVALQKIATDKLRMSSAKVMDIAQKLYQKGFISYPRTQTNSFPKTMDLLDMVRRFQHSSVYGDYSQKLLNSKFIQPKLGNQDDMAHSPIHPVKPAQKDSMNPQQWKVFDLVTRHFLACCSGDAIGEEFEVKGSIGSQLFKATYLSVKERNYLQIYPFEKWIQNTIPEEIPNQLQALVSLDENKTSPPAYLTESQLITLMEKNQIGTDSTIHEHIQTIQNRRYAIKNNNTFKPTNLGVAIIVSYRKFGVKLPECQIRRMIQKNMDSIANGTKSRQQATTQTLSLMIPIYQHLISISDQWGKEILAEMNQHQALTIVEGKASQFESESPRSQTALFKCEKCQKNVCLRYSTRNKHYFLGCSGYPNCRVTLNVPLYIKQIIPKGECSLCGNSSLCALQIKEISLVQPELLKYRILEIGEPCITLCLKPGCDPHFYNFSTLSFPFQNSNPNKNNNNTSNYGPQFQNSNNRSNCNDKTYFNKNQHHSTSASCFNCMQKGHYLKDCLKSKMYQSSMNTKKSNSFQQKKYICYRCGEEGHIAPNCPNKSNLFSKEGQGFKDNCAECKQCGCKGRHPKHSDCPQKHKSGKKKGNNNFSR